MSKCRLCEDTGEFLDYCLCPAGLARAQKDYDDAEAVEVSDDRRKALAAKIIEKIRKLDARTQARNAVKEAERAALDLFEMWAQFSESQEPCIEWAEAREVLEIIIKARARLVEIEKGVQG